VGGEKGEGYKRMGDEEGRERAKEEIQR